MSPELIEQLKLKYPKMWNNADIQVGDGWYNLLLALTESIDKIMHRLRSERLKVLRFNRALRDAINGKRWKLYHFLWKNENNYSIHVSHIKRAELREIEIDELIAKKEWRDVPDRCPWPTVDKVMVRNNEERPLFIMLNVKVNLEISKNKWPHNSILVIAYSFAKMSKYICEICGNTGKLVVDENYKKFTGKSAFLFRSKLKIRCKNCTDIDENIKLIEQYLDNKD